MKKRLNFVSNSSSSSFIVIKKGKKDKIKKHSRKKLIVPSIYGDSAFGWDEHTYYDFYTKLNFCVFQCLYVWHGQGEEWFEMLKEVIQSKLKLELELEKGENVYDYDGYIDHQSSSYEGRNTKMFNNKEDLETFLFSSSSYLQTGNDNE